MSDTLELFVATDGSDAAAGTRKAPLRSPQAAVRKLRVLRKKDPKRPAVVTLLPGRHQLRKTLTLGPADSQVTFRGEKGAVLSGGRVIGGWKPGEINGVAAWWAPVRKGEDFKQLWVNGRRAERTRLPERGLFQIETLLDPIEDPTLKHQFYVQQERFTYKPGDLRAFANLGDVEFVALHYWIESRVPIATLDESTRTVELAFKPRMRLTDDHTPSPAHYYVENVREALRRPGQWYLDRAAGRVWHIPRKGERIDRVEAIAPVLDTIVDAAGDVERGERVQGVRFEGVTFSHNEYRPDEASRRATPQAACHVPGAVRLTFARGCALDHCNIAHVGGYGVEFGDGSDDGAVTGCHLHDLAGGGVKVFHAVLDTTGSDKIRGKGMVVRPCRRVTIRDCHIHDGGHRHRQAVGVLIGKCSGCIVEHNHIHGFDYTGVSVGWTWGYTEGECYGNIVEWNHIHDIGRGVLSDMGGIYTLGQQQGTRLRFNHIHDVESRGYGGWGIYPDEGSTDILIECNLVYRTKYAPIHQHYGRDNVVQNNIFALGRRDMLALGKWESHNAFTLRRNIFYMDQPNVLSGGYNAKPDAVLPAAVDHNLYWCAGKDKALRFRGRNWKRWQQAGFDRHSIVADPRFRDVTRDDFTLSPKSLAVTKLGFVPFDVSAAGTRGRVGC